MGEEKRDNLLERLRNGETLRCSRCGTGHMVPYNASADKAHSFNCSNPECNNYIHWDPVIELE